VWIGPKDGKLLPVVDGGEVVGVVSIGDLVKFQVEAAELRDPVSDRLHQRALRAAQGLPNVRLRSYPALEARRREEVVEAEIAAAFDPQATC
jgi:CBS domain-containing protein